MTSVVWHIYHLQKGCAVFSSVRVMEPSRKSGY